MAQELQRHRDHTSTQAKCVDTRTQRSACGDANTRAELTDTRANAHTEERSQPEANRAPVGTQTVHKVRVERPVMILPQVHLRKPCYDFSFL